MALATEALKVNLTKRELSEAVVVDVEGKLVGGPDEAATFHAFFKALVNEGHKKIVVNLRRSPWANSQGIGMLIGAYASFKNAGGELVLAHVGDRVGHILDVTKLYQVFKTFDTEDEAVKHLTFGG